MERVAVLCNGLGIVNRGAERFTKEFVRHLKNRFEIDVYSALDTKTPTRNEIHIPWRNGKAYRESYLFGKKLYKDDLLKDYDVILNNSGFPCSYWCNKIRKKHGIPFITRARGGGREEYLSRIFKPDHMVFLSPQHQEKIAKGIPSSVIPNAIDLDDYKEKKKTNLLDGLERPIYLSTSAFVKYKRPELIAEAVRFTDKGTLVWTSDGPLRKKILEYCEQIIPKRYKYLGVLPIKELIPLYQNSDVFVNASRSEAFGVVFLEAIASGTPVVTQKDSKREQIIGKSGILVNCWNSIAFSEAMMSAVTTEFDFEETLKKFSWENVAKMWEKCLK